jgi:hypothetical protein
MLPPSPQTYHPRFLHQSSIANGNIPQNVTRDLPPPQHRPTSSMSISSMLGSESERPAREHNPAVASSATSSYHSKYSNPFSDMSPPQQSVNPGPSDYSYKPRSQTPDRMGISNLLGTRPYRSGSGSIMQGSRPFVDQARPSSRPVFPRIGEPIQQPQSQEPARRTEESIGHARRTSISGILQRPSSQPQPQAHSITQGPRLQTVNHPQPNRPAWPEHSNTPNPLSFNASSPPSFGGSRAPEHEKIPQNGQSAPSTTPATQYDIRPPGFSSSAQQQSSTSQDRDLQSRVSAWERPPSNSTSPDTRRQFPAQSQYKPFGALLNGQAGTPNSQPQENQQASSIQMNKQDSSQSHGERSIFGEKLDKSRSRLFSPFAGSHTSQSLPSGSARPEEQSRKGSDELSQHRALLGLAAEGKRGGRYSPLPQAVQGAQAQSIGPEIGIKTEHGRIFSGLGSGVGSASANSTHGPAGLVASPFKRDESGSRLLNEENLMKMSRSTSGFGKRARKVKEEDGKAASENDGPARAGKKPRNHQ